MVWSLEIAGRARLHLGIGFACRHSEGAKSSKQVHCTARQVIPKVDPARRAAEDSLA